jgi:hypothetical protein
MQEQTTLKIQKQTLPFLNISLYLNDIKPVQSLTIENTSEIDSASLEIKITADLPCIEPFSFTISSVPAKKEVKIPLENLKVNRDFLNKLSETEKANITIEVFENEVSILKEGIPAEHATPRDVPTPSAERGRAPAIAHGHALGDGYVVGGHRIR